MQNFNHQSQRITPSKFTLLFLILCLSFNQGKTQCNPTVLSLNYNFTIQTAGDAVEVTWNFDCPTASINISLFENSNFIVVQTSNNHPNSGSYTFTIDPDLPAGTYGFYIEDVNRTFWNYGPRFQLDALLPVEFVNFYGQKNNNTIQLHWETATELGNAGFEIQKSSDGITWKTIDFVKGQGTTADLQTYQYQDKQPFSGVNYYRLKQMNANGSFDYSKVTAVEYDYSEMPIKAFPNPSNGLINLQLDNPQRQPMSIKIADYMGRIIWENKVLNKASNLQQEIALRHSGIYIATVQIGNDVYRKQLVVTNDN